MLDNLTTFFQFPLLNHVGVSLHTIDSKGFGETVGNQRIGVQTGERDELPTVWKRMVKRGLCALIHVYLHETKLGQLPDVFFHVLVVQSRGSPIERGRQV